MTRSITAFWFLLKCVEGRKSRIPAWRRTPDLDRDANAGALSQRTEIVEDRLIGVVTAIIASDKSFTDSEAAITAVVYSENKSVQTTMGCLARLITSQEKAKPGWGGGTAPDSSGKGFCFFREEHTMHCS